MLRNEIEYRKKGQEELQKIYYRWVRQAYRAQLPEVEDIPNFIFNYGGHELAEALQGVHFKKGAEPRRVRGGADQRENRELQLFQTGLAQRSRQGAGV